MNVTYDKYTDAAYVYLLDKITAGAVARTIELKKDITLDFDKDGKLLGIEVLHASKIMS